MYYWLFRFFPKRQFSQCLGWLASLQLPPLLLRLAISLYARLFAIDLSQFAPGPFPTFNAFFIRPLRQGARPLPEDPQALASPCDGRVIESGPIENGRMLQVKGRNFRIEQLLGAGWVPLLSPPEAFEGGSFLSIYLSPADYHRFHSPCDAELLGVSHLPGALWTVSPLGLRGVRNLFVRNERAVLHLQTAFGPAALIPVAATGVGDVRLTHYPLHSRPRRSRPRAEQLKAPLPLRRGEELGHFRMGSTVILLLPPGKVELRPLQPTAPLKLCQPIGTILSEA